MRVLFLSAALLIPVAAAQGGITVNDIPALPPGVTAPPAPSTPAEPATAEPATEEAPAAEEAPATEEAAPEAEAAATETTAEAPADTTPAGPVAKVEIQEVEVTAPASTGTTPTVASDDVGEVIIPVLATDKDGKPVAGVEITWEVKNTGKAPVYVISSQSGEEATQIAATIAPDATVTYKTVTGADGKASILFNATASTAAALKLTSSLGEVKNMREAAQSIDWLGQ